ncbi:Sulfite reductase [NADPH] subunit beta [Dimargaris verticillata]|uniref:assimilatory sulfite reductase (NADPH) n=1 Tax=Dimargaris verticillata TaxID=2761393 RepID=A0A9W8EDD7_9FUNG|nr:Sulfite reductase [NADPH] subunit beta [Dimargaris verticillata]
MPVVTAERPLLEVTSAQASALAVSVLNHEVVVVNVPETAAVLAQLRQTSTTQTSHGLRIHPVLPHQGPATVLLERLHAVGPDTVVSLYTPSRLLTAMIPQLHTLAHQQLPCVIHVVPDLVGPDSNTVATAWSSLLAVRDAGCALILSDGRDVQQVHDLTAVSTRVAYQTRVPVIHGWTTPATALWPHDQRGTVQQLPVTGPFTVFRSGSPETLEAEAKELQTDSHPLPTTALPTAAFTSSYGTFSASLSQSIVQAFDESVQLLENAQYAIVERTGALQPTTVYVSFLNAQAQVDTRRDAIVSVRLVRPFPALALVRQLYPQAERVVVLDPSHELSHQWGPLYLHTVDAVHSDLWGQIHSQDSQTPAPGVVAQRLEPISASLPPSAAADHQPLRDAVESIPYTKLLTDLFHARLDVTNAADTTSIWGAPDSEATRPSYGFGKMVSTLRQRNAFVSQIRNQLQDPATAQQLRPELYRPLAAWVQALTSKPSDSSATNPATAIAAGEQVKSCLDTSTGITDLTAAERDLVNKLQSHASFLVPQSSWIVGADAWAYDLGGSGIHHVIASGLNVNMLVLDTVPYSDRHHSRWQNRRKKDIGLYAMSYGGVYVASVAIYSSYTQVLQALMEADAFPGPAVVLAYLPQPAASVFNAQALPLGSVESVDGSVALPFSGFSALEALKESKLAVDNGYWPLYRWQPAITSQLQPTFHLDSERIKADLQKFLDRENRMALVARQTPQVPEAMAQPLHHNLLAQHRQAQAQAKEAFWKLTQGLQQAQGPALLVLSASDNGNGDDVAKRVYRNGLRRGLAARHLAMDDFSIEDMGLETNVVLVVSTAGQGEFPTNGREFWKALAAASDINLSDTHYAVFGLGDSHYWPREEDYIYYNKPAKDLDDRLEVLGGRRLLPVGLGDDQDVDGFETAFATWEPELWKALNADRINQDIAVEEEVKVTDDQNKVNSNFLRGTIAQGLADTSTGALAESDTKLTKFHGIYQQDDRDLREGRTQEGLEPAYSFMVRVRLPAGTATPQQWLDMDALSESHANGSLKITTRQTFQLHGVVKANLKGTIQGINRSLMDTLAACGDVNRNVICNAAPYQSAIHYQVWKFSQKLSEHLLPQTSAYHEIWLDDKLVAGNAVNDVEPLYGPNYLPRKFKVAVAVPPSNDVDVFAHDLGFIPILENPAGLAAQTPAMATTAEPQRILGYNVTVGGGMGMAHNNKKTYPRLADLLGFCTPDQAVDVAEKVMLVQRDHGDRVNRKHARMKYTIDDHGLPWFREQVEARLGYKLDAARPFQFTENGDRYGWMRGNPGEWHFGMFIQNGRVVDRPGYPLKSGLRELAKVHKGYFRMTCNQGLVIASVPDDQVDTVKQLLTRYKLDNVDHSGLRLNSMACVALPTCALAMAESERYLPSLMTHIEEILSEAGLRDDAITIRMTGCPNGCARPYIAEIALVGKAPGAYNLYLGGGFAGQRLNKLYAESLGEAQILDALRPLIKAYAIERTEGEHFGDYVIRVGAVKETTHGTNFHA